MNTGFLAFFGKRFSAAVLASLCGYLLENSTAASEKNRKELATALLEGSTLLRLLVFDRATR